jgi:hypothetical protein
LYFIIIIIIIHFRVRIKNSYSYGSNVANYIDRKRENERKIKRDLKAKTCLRSDSCYGTSESKCLFLMKGDLFGKSDQLNDMVVRIFRFSRRSD